MGALGRRLSLGHLEVGTDHQRQFGGLAKGQTVAEELLQEVT